MDDAHVAEARSVYGTGTFSDILAFRIREVPSILPLHVSVFPRTVSLFLFGAYVWRTGLLQRASLNRHLLLGVSIIGIAAGMGLTFVSDGHALSGWPVVARGLFLVRESAPVLLAFGYGAIVIYLVSHSPGRRILAWAAPLGRMAFTNYLVQSVVLGWVFYGYGLGLFGQLGAAAALVIGVVLYAAQAALSAWWLSRFCYGPVEWLWRALMYGVPPRLRAPDVINVRMEGEPNRPASM